MTRDFSKEYCHLRNFEDLAYDAVHLLYLAHDVDSEEDQHGYEYMYVRSSILNTLLLFECGANCCIDSLNLSGSYVDDIDKLPFLSKYEFFLRNIKPHTKLDRGCKETQTVAELKSIRDSYVHPKEKKQKYIQIEQFAWEADFGETNILEIPRSPKEWGCSHAVSVLKATNDFFNIFFLSWCEFDTDTVCEILMGSEEAAIPARSSVHIDCMGGLDRAVKDWNIDFKFLGKIV